MTSTQMNLFLSIFPPFPYALLTSYSFFIVSRERPTWGKSRKKQKPLDYVFPQTRTIRFCQVPKKQKHLSVKEWLTERVREAAGKVKPVKAVMQTCSESPGKGPVLPVGGGVPRSTHSSKSFECHLLGRPLQSCETRTTTSLGWQRFRQRKRMFTPVT